MVFKVTTHANSKNLGHSLESCYIEQCKQGQRYGKGFQWTNLADVPTTT